MAGGALAGAAGSLVGVAWPAAVIGGLNGLVSGGRRIYRWRHPSGWLAFALDSTWGLPMTTAAVAAHAIGVVRGRPGFVAALSERCNRHVYTRGLRVRRGFVVTLGNTVNAAGDSVHTSARRQRLITDHEDVHVWQGRWFGPMFPVLYVGWTVVGAVAGAGVWVVRRVARSPRRDPFASVVETCSYYLNPFEWWAYSRDGFWPPPGKVTGLGWELPAVGPKIRNSS